MKFSLLIPEITLFSGALLILMLDVFFNKKNEKFQFFAHFFALIICGIALAFAVKTFGSYETAFNDMINSRALISFIKCIVIALLTFIILISIRYIFTIEKYSSEYLALLMIATVGGLLMISANDLLLFYLGLELQALSLYLLASFNVKSAKSSEAGIKYFILGSLASGILLFGISMVYGFSGTTNLTLIKDLIEKTKPDEIPVGLIFGLIMVITAMLFKISSAPFHMWAPDVYQGAPSAVLAFFGTVVKFSTVMALLLLSYSANWQILSKIFLLAFSSIGHIGFVLLALCSMQKYSYISAILYMIIYSIISLGTFAFLTIIRSPQTHENDATDDKIFNINSLAGLAKTNPTLALSLSILMFSSAGIPPLAGFFSKFYIIKTAILTGLLPYAIIAVIFSAVSAFYYLRIVKIMYFDQPNAHIEIEDFGNSRLVII
ncbi:MAG: NADH-quinone oxidoreductase subunit N, partial [Proteobacteria bacterium]|nr:NADH-quinone oxidoreductase subunit N [Pseudomonadota bacterium]